MRPPALSELNELLARSAESGDLASLRRILAYAPADADFGSALREAASRGFADCVQALIPCCLGNGFGALALAAAAGHAECVKLLIPIGDPMAFDSYCLEWAVENGRAECAKLLIPVSDPKAKNSSALSLAALKGHADCVGLLIPVCEPTANGSAALRRAAEFGRSQCVKLLLPVSGSLLDDPSLCSSAISHGRATVLSIMLAHEPRLADALDFPAIHADALRRGFHDLAAFAAAFVDQRELSSSLSVGSAPSRSPAHAARL